MKLHHHYTLAKHGSRLLDKQFSLFGLRFGLDPILGLIPFFGDIITLALSSYMVWIAVQMKIPANKIARMVFHVVVDFLIGLVPVVGDFTDFVFKANSLNFKILEEHRENAFIIDAEVVNTPSIPLNKSS